MQTKTIRCCYCITLAIVPLIFMSPSGTAAEKAKAIDKTKEVKRSTDEVSFNLDIRPLLSSRCFSCHGPDPESREAGLRLDQADGDEGAIGLAIEPGSVEDSEMWYRITSEDESEIMPPPDSHLKPLSKAEQDLIRRWIESGAEYQGFWAFEPPVNPAPPAVENAGWSQQAIDRHVLAKLESRGRSPSQTADPRTLIRRVTFDLTGLPPTRDEIAEFLTEYQQAPDAAWEQLVDRLLASPRYGEHVGRYWLDLVRYADSNGMHKDFFRNQVPYRDWVIRSFNENLGYDDFLRYQIAGDLFPQPTRDQLIASGFNRLHLIIDRGTALPKESFTKNVIDRVTAVSTAFMGLTVQCAQCHDHKFDPITQKDFYSLSAFFNNIDARPETVSRDGPVMGLQEPFISLATEKQQQQLDTLDRRIAVQKKKVQQAEAEVDTPTGAESDSAVASDEGVSEPAVPKPLQRLRKQLKQLEAQRTQLDRTIPKAMVMKERPTVRPTFLLKRGQYDDPGEEVPRDTPGFLPELKTQGEVPSRMDLAEWFVDPDHPLTARVAVNRFWQQLFGVGLVKTSEDLGSQGDVPSHPGLLDHLAVEFMQSGWDIKALMKTMVMSKTYRQASSSTPEQFQADSENRLLSRGPRYRLDAEMIRDQILATSGSLSDSMYGPSVKPPQPEGLWEAVSMTGETYQADQGEAARRRSVYTFWKRSMPPPQMTILNAPFRDSCVARRERTNTPTQALLLLNESEYLKAARNLAEQILQQPADQRLDVAWETVTGKLPDDQEKSVLERLLVDLRGHYASDLELASQLSEGAQLSDGIADSELAAWTILSSVLYNMDITKNKD